VTRFVEQPQAIELVKLSGRIENYRCTRARASFVFTQADRTKMGVLAIAAGLAGLGGQAMTTASNASDLEEDADLVEFSIDGKSIKGWVWRSPFKDGDLVDVAAVTRGSDYESFGIARLNDRTVALYPHCSRGHIRHFANAAKWWLVLTSLPILLLCWLGRDVMQQLVAEGILQWSVLGVAAFFFLMVFSLSRKWLPFVRVAENVFRTLGWSNPSNIDLKKRTKARRTKNDPVEYGRFYFYY